MPLLLQGTTMPLEMCKKLVCKASITTIKVRKREKGIQVVVEWLYRRKLRHLSKRLCHIRMLWQEYQA